MPTKKVQRGTKLRKTSNGASSPPGAQSRTSAAATGKASKTNASQRARATATDWDALSRRTPAQIRQGILADPNARATTPAFWKNAALILPAPKQIVTIRLDADLLGWLRQRAGYQTRINAILRSYMQAQSE